MRSPRRFCEDGDHLHVCAAFVPVVMYVEVAGQRYEQTESFTYLGEVRMPRRLRENCRWLSA